VKGAFFAREKGAQLSSRMIIMKQESPAVSLSSYALDESGASLVEYSLLTGLVSIAILAAIASISGNLAITWSILASIVAQAASG
jgi:Flp pilus assembly pilin Flp